MMNRIIPFTFLIVLSLFSCNKKNSSKSSLPDNVLENDFKFKSLTVRAKIDYLDENQNLSTPVQIRIRQDSAIWMSITPALGIEMMRVLIRKDSVFMMNRLKKEYFAGSFDYLKNYLGIDVNYKLVEKIMMGNIPLKNTNNQKSTKTDSHYILEQMFSQFVITNMINRENKRMSNLSIKGESEDFNTVLNYSDFELIGNVDFAKNINLIKTQGTSKTMVDVKYNKPKIDDNPISLPFSIPKSYDPIKMQ